MASAFPQPGLHEAYRQRNTTRTPRVTFAGVNDSRQPRPETTDPEGTPEYYIDHPDTPPPLPLRGILFPQPTHCPYPYEIDARYPTSTEDGEFALENGDNNSVMLSQDIQNLEQQVFATPLDIPSEIPFHLTSPDRNGQDHLHSARTRALPGRSSNIPIASSSSTTHDRRSTSPRPPSRSDTDLGNDHRLEERGQSFAKLLIMAGIRGSDNALRDNKHLLEGVSRSLPRDQSHTQLNPGATEMKPKNLSTKSSSTHVPVTSTAVGTNNLRVCNSFTEPMKCLQRDFQQTVASETLISRNKHVRITETLCSKIEDLQKMVDHLEKEKAFLAKTHEKNLVTLIKQSESSIMDLAECLSKQNYRIKTIKKDHEKQIKNLKSEFISKEAYYNRAFLEVKRKYGDKIDGLSRDLYKIESKHW